MALLLFCSSLGTCSLESFNGNVGCRVVSEESEAVFLFFRNESLHRTHLPNPHHSHPHSWPPGSDPISSCTPFLGSSSPSWMSVGASGPYPRFQALFHGSSPSVIACFVPVRVDPAYLPSLHSLPLCLPPCYSASDSFHTAPRTFCLDSFLLESSLLELTVSPCDASLGKPSQNAMPCALLSHPGPLLLVAHQLSVFSFLGGLRAWSPMSVS